MLDLLCNDTDLDGSYPHNEAFILETILKKCTTVTIGKHAVKHRAQQTCEYADIRQLNAEIGGFSCQEVYNIL